jgi:hypothetical protein
MTSSWLGGRCAQKFGHGAGGEAVGLSIAVFSLSSAVGMEGRGSDHTAAVSLETEYEDTKGASAEPWAIEGYSLS